MKTKRYQAVLAIILAFVITLFLQNPSLAARTKTKAPTYNAVQLEQIQAFAPTVAEFSQKIQQAEALIDAEQWTEIRNLIHGPLGELRRTTGRVAQNLIGSDRVAAKAAEVDLFKHLVDLDTAAKAQNYKLCLKSYNAVLADFNTFLSIIPESAT